MAQLRQDYAKFMDRQTEVILIGPEDAAGFADYWRKNRLPFIGLPDPQESVLRRYGQEVNLFKLGRMPAQVIVDRRGIARYVHYGNSMSDNPGNEEIFALLDQINQEQATYDLEVGYSDQILSDCEIHRTHQAMFWKGRKL